MVLTSPNGVKTPFGTSPRSHSFEVGYIFTAGRYDIDNTRVYLPFATAQRYFNAENQIDSIHIFIDDPDKIELFTDEIQAVATNSTYLWSWKQASGYHSIYFGVNCRVEYRIRDDYAGKKQGA